MHGEELVQVSLVLVDADLEDGGCIVWTQERYDASLGLAALPGPNEYRGRHGAVGSLDG